MKKIIALSLGFSFVATSLVVPFTVASPLDYHRYMTRPENFQDYRHFSEGVPRGRTYRSSRTQAVNTNQRTHLYRGSRMNRPTVRGTDSSLTRRTSTNRTAPLTRQAHSGYQPRVTITPTIVKQVQARLYTYENDEFSLLLPTGWTLTSNEGGVHYYQNANADYELRVKYFADNSCADSLGFVACANQIARAENYLAVEGSGKLEVTTKIVRSNRKENTVLNRLGVKTDTYTEQFNGLHPFEGESTYSRHYVSAPNGGVFMIEAQVPYKLNAGYTEITKRVFDSFRIYPTDTWMPAEEATETEEVIEPTE